jgi:hypothetical protein
MHGVTMLPGKAYNEIKVRDSFTGTTTVTETYVVLAARRFDHLPAASYSCSASFATRKLSTAAGTPP